VTHATCTGGLSTLTLFGPVDYTSLLGHTIDKKKGKLTRSDLGGGITTLSTSLLLLVERTVTTTSAESVGFGVTLTEGTSTFSLYTKVNIMYAKKNKRRVIHPTFKSSHYPHERLVIVFIVLIEHW
jgi:hypothetical protein